MKSNKLTAFLSWNFGSQVWLNRYFQAVVEHSDQMSLLFGTILNKFWPLFLYTTRSQMLWKVESVLKMDLHQTQLSGTVATMSFTLMIKHVIFQIYAATNQYNVMFKYLMHLFFTMKLDKIFSHSLSPKKG